MQKTVCTLSLAILVVYLSIEAKISHQLLQQLDKASADEMVSCIVVMKTKYPYEQMRSVPVKERIRNYRAIAWESQQPLINRLNVRSSDVEKCMHFWVLNGLYIKAKPAVIFEIAKRADVENIFQNGTVCVAPVSSTPSPRPRGVEWGVLKIEADKCWDEGYTGEGVIIGITDTGVDYLHPALKDKWSGHWHVSAGMEQKDKPYDDFNHGTHCMGTILGGDGRGPSADDIGIAPGAKYAAAKVLNGAGSGTTAQVIEGLQYMADLKDTVDIRVVSNSWGETSSGFTDHFEICKTLKSIGILPLFANGNSGAGGVCSPGDFPVVMGIGATDNADKIATFSSLGPSPQIELYKDKSLWFRDDWNYIKPNISAPGVTIRSCIPNGNFQDMSGTSMATPHVCGAVALLLQKNKNLTPEILYSILLDNTDKPAAGGPYPNNTFGWGRLNAYKALQGTPTMNQPWLHVLKKDMGALNPGASVNLTVTVKNTGGVDAGNANAALVSYDNYVSVQNGSYTFGTIGAQATAANTGAPFILNAHTLTPQGHTAKLGLILRAKAPQDSLNFLDTVPVIVTVGSTVAPVTVFCEDFEYSGSVDSFPIIWETAGNWSRVADQSNSASHSASSGAPATTNSLTLKIGVNLSYVANPKLVFWTRDVCDWPEDWKEVNISASKDNGASWKEIFTFTGTDKDNPSWREKETALSEYTADNVRFKFVFSGTGATPQGTFWIDDIRILVPYDNEPPCFTNTTLWPETHLTGPFPVQSTITDENGVVGAALYFRVNNGSWNKLDMSSSGADVYKASLPAQNGTGKIEYYLEAADKWMHGSNKGTYPIGASQSSGYHSFIFGSSAVQNSPQAGRFSVYTSFRSGAATVRFNLQEEMNITCSMIDMLGREVAVVARNNMKKGSHSLALNTKGAGSRSSMASGLYFIHFKATPAAGHGEKGSSLITRRIVLVK